MSNPTDMHGYLRRCTGEHRAARRGEALRVDGRCMEVDILHGRGVDHGAIALTK
jgi:hypothetical protein